jgi:hypothetical protein
MEDSPKFPRPGLAQTVIHSLDQATYISQEVIIGMLTYSDMAASRGIYRYSISLYLFSTFIVFGDIYR